MPAMAGAPGSETSGHYVSPRFIGRRAERATLAQAVATLRAGEGTVVLIEGEAGIGKSRLLDEGLREARSNGARVLIGGCVRLDDDAAPLAPIAEALRNLAAETPSAELAGLLGPAREVLAGLLPGLTDPVGVSNRARPSLSHSHSSGCMSTLSI